MDGRERILSAPMGRLCMSLSAPAIAGLLLMGAATFADAAFVGLLAGKQQLAAILLAFPLTLLNSALAALIGSGAAAMASRALGAGDKGAIRSVGGAFLGWTLLASLVATAGSVVAARPLLALIGAQGAALESGVVYIRIVFAASLPLNFVFGASFLIRGAGGVARSMMLLGGGSLLHVALDLVFVGFWSMGAEGAAWATLATAVATALATVIDLWRAEPLLEARRWRPSLSHLGPMVRDGAAATLVYAMTILQQAIVFAVAARWGTNDDVLFVGAYSRLYMLAMVPLWGFVIALLPVIGVNHGAGKPERVREAVKVFSMAASLTGVVLAALAATFPQTTLGLFIDDAELITRHTPAFRLLLLPFPTLGLQLVVAALLISVGRGISAALLLVLRNVVVLTPLLVVLPHVLGLDGVWAAMVATDVACFAMAVALSKKAYRQHHEDSRLADAL